MIQNEVQFRQTLEQLQQMYLALSELREEVLPKNPRNFAILAEGPLDYIRQFLEELEAYRLSLLTGPQAPESSRRVG